MSKDPKQTVELWLADPNRSLTATMGAGMLRGQWLSSVDAEELGSSGAVLGQVRRTLKEMATSCSSATPGPADDGLHRQATPQGLKTVTREQAGDTHPHLGATLTVQALALVDGELVMSLSNGTGSWMVKVTGQVGQ